jgi:YHS domain-containing protein
MKKILISCVILLAALYTQAQKSPIYKTNQGAINGYDVVAFFTDNKAIKGDSAFTTTYQQAKWYFKNAKNLQAFVANPEKYLPQYGGYCAYGCSDNHKAPTEANTFTIIDNKLYFNYNNKVKEFWIKDAVEKRIPAADKNWTTLKDSE